MNSEEYAEHLRNPQIHMCSHMRPVVFTSGAEGSRFRDDLGWYHVAPGGTLENHAPACEAGIFRFNVRIPDDAFYAGNALLEHDEHRGYYDPSSKTVNERYKQEKVT